MTYKEKCACGARLKLKQPGNGDAYNNTKAIETWRSGHACNVPKVAEEALDIGAS